jgi:hypothetical protein
MIFYLLTAQTTHLRQNAFGRYLKDFAALYGAALLAVVVDVVAGLAVIVKIRSGLDADKLMSLTWLNVLNSLCQISYAFYAICGSYSTALVLQPKYWSELSSRGMVPPC